MAKNSLSKTVKALLILSFGCHGFSEPPTDPSQAISKTLHFSECSQQPCSQEESIQYVYDLEKLTITHNNTWLGCGIKGVELLFKEQTPGIIRISENEIREIFTNPNGTTHTVVEFCLCYYTSIYEIQNIKSGHYDFEIKHPTFGIPTSVPIVIDESKHSYGLIKIRSVPVDLSRKSTKTKWTYSIRRKTI